MSNRTPRNLSIKVETGVPPSRASSNMGAKGGAPEDAIDIDDLEEKVELEPKLWVNKSELPRKIKELCAKMFEEVADDASEDDALNKNLIRMARIATTQDVKWVLSEHEDWTETLEEAVKARKKEYDFYERTLKKVHIDDESQFRRIVGKANARYSRAKKTLKKLDEYMQILVDHLTDG